MGKHYSGFRPLWFCEPDERYNEFYRRFKAGEFDDSIKFAESIANSRNGIDP